MSTYEKAVLADLNARAALKDEFEEKCEKKRETILSLEEEISELRGIIDELRTAKAALEVQLAGEKRRQEDPDYPNTSEKPWFLGRE